MKLNMSIVAMLVLMTQAGCAITVGVKNPLARLQDSPCSSKRARLGEIIACYPVYVERDIWDSRGLPALTTALEQAGVRVLRNRPNRGTSREYLVIRLHSSGAGYGNNSRVRIEVRDEDGNLRYYNEELIPTWHYWNEIPGVTERLCPVSPVRCP